ncbi:MAG TPA: MgtC/SapB family protein [Xanthomonadales bacterium]|nr:MgtC/SapB family protein [Xanthomonadales bacterium]
MDIQWAEVWMNLLHLAVAYVLALPVAMDREHANRGAGLRTFPLVAVAACGYMLVGMSVLETTDAESRVIQGLITGIGFIGGGAILKSDGYVKGTATAAAIWITGLLGLAVATNRFEIAILLSVISFLTLRFMRSFKTPPDKKEEDEEEGKQNAS